MKASKFSKASKAFILKRGKEGTPVAEIFREAGISQVAWTSTERSSAVVCCLT